jgi:nifR3 family TIM-barrel protein
MSKGFWDKLSKKKPFFVLAPMHDVTDSAFRQTVLKCGRPDVFYTEFAPVDGIHSKEGRPKVMHYLKFSKKEKPIVAQVFGCNPEHFYESAKLAAKLGFDGIDINMGCSVVAIQKQGAGSALIKTPDLAVEIIEATKRGAGKLPVSVKTRIGHSKKEIKKWIPKILSAKPAALTIHGRTAKQGYGGEADWEAIKEVAELANGTGVLVIGNGDIKNYEEGILRAKESGCDGVMIGRAALKNPWVFNSKKKEPSVKERLSILAYHLNLFKKPSINEQGFSYFKKYVAGYISEFPSAKEMRIKMMDTSTAEELEKVIKNYLKNL